MGFPLQQTRIHSCLQHRLRHINSFTPAQRGAWWVGRRTLWEWRCNPAEAYGTKTSHRKRSKKRLEKYRGVMKLESNIPAKCMVVLRDFLLKVEPCLGWCHINDPWSTHFRSKSCEVFICKFFSLMFFKEKSQLIFVYYLELQSQPVLKWIFNDYQATISDVKMGFIVHLIQLFMTGCDIGLGFLPWQLGNWMEMNASWRVWFVVFGGLKRVKKPPTRQLKL